MKTCWSIITGFTVVINWKTWCSVNNKVVFVHTDMVSSTITWWWNVVDIFCTLSPFSLWFHIGTSILLCGTAWKKERKVHNNTNGSWIINDTLLIANSTVSRNTNHTIRMVAACSATTLFPQATIGGRWSLVKGVSEKSSITGMVEARVEKLHVPSRHCSKQVDRED